MRSALNCYWPDAEVKYCTMLFVCNSIKGNLCNEGIMTEIPIQCKNLTSHQEYMGEHKIGSREEYSSMAQEFCHRLRGQIKESYLTFHGTLKVLIFPQYIDFSADRSES